MKSFLTFLVVAFTCLSPLSAHPKYGVYIYDDEGVGPECLVHTKRLFQSFLDPQNYTVNTLNATNVIQGAWVRNAVLFVMPGGADTPYAKKLNGKGNDVIKKFVRGGGSYLGFCAGAYYASAEVEFDVGGPLQVIGPRELKFFNGTAWGPVLAPYNPTSEKGARAAKINLDPTLSLPTPLDIYFNGGCSFKDTSLDDTIALLGTYAQKDNDSAIILTADRRALLSCVHFEIDPYRLGPEDKKLIPALKRSNNARLELANFFLSLLGLVTTYQNDSSLHLGYDNQNAGWLQQ